VDVQASVEAGVRELMLVTGGTHAGEFLRLLPLPRLSGAHRRHAEALGLAEQFVGADPVVVMLGTLGLRVRDRVRGGGGLGDWRNRLDHGQAEGLSSPLSLCRSSSFSWSVMEAITAACGEAGVG
jgi:hypothetical protein